MDQKFLGPNFDRKGAHGLFSNVLSVPIWLMDAKGARHEFRILYYRDGEFKNDFVGTYKLALLYEKVMQHVKANHATCVVAVEWDETDVTGSNMRAPTRMAHRIFAA